MKIYIGADHAGFKLKEKLKLFFKENYNFIESGAKKLDNLDDYPKYAARVGRNVVQDKNSFGILICGSGQGVCIAANKIKGIRAALCEHVIDAKLARKDDNCNVLCLQGRYTKFEDAKKIIKKFLETKFSKERKYLRRINQIKKLEK